MPNNQSDGDMEFIPQGWKPEAGDFEMELIHINDVPWPVVVFSEQGIISPRYKPKSCTHEEFIKKHLN
jgi:hypothetical protein